MRIDASCAKCGNAFVTLQSRIDKGNGKYCSKSCSAKGQRRRIEKTCPICSKTFEATVGSDKKGYGKFCEAKCYFKSEEVRIGGRSGVGKILSKETKEKISKAKKGKPGWCLGLELPNRQGTTHHNWKGDDVGYIALHSWIRRKLGRPPACEKCGAIGRMTGNIKPRWNIEHANKSGEYLRNISDWLSLCKPCHGRYDKQERVIKRIRAFAQPILPP